MGLSHIRTLRRAGRKPAMVNILIGGRAPAWLDDGPLLVRVGESAQPRAMDWTPLMGVWVTVHWLSGPKHLALEVVNALEAVEAKLFGATGPGFVAPLTTHRDDAMHAVLREEREALCTTA